MTSWHVQGQLHLHLFQHYYTLITKKSLPTLTNMMTPMKPTTIMPTDDGHFVGCVDLASMIKSAKQEMQHNLLNM